MLLALAGILRTCALFAALGLGPLLLLAPSAGIGTILALAPAVGYALVSLCLTVWLMDAGSVAAAVAPLSLGLGAVSLACLLAARPGWRAWLGRLSWRRTIPGLAGLALCLGLLTAPLAAGNAGYAVFRGNASDSFIYMFLARYFDGHSRAWAVEHPSEAAPENDPVLGPSRAMLNIRWTSGAMLAFAARVAGQGVLDFQYPFTLASLAMFFAAMLPFLAAMGLSPAWAALLSLALATGFYGQFVLDLRAFSQLNIMPLTVFLAWAMSLPPARGRGETLRRVGLLGLAWVACFVNYTEIFPMLLGAAAAFFLLKAAGRRLTRAEAAVQAGGLVLGLAASWPVRFLYGHMLAQIQFTETAPELWAEAYFRWLFDDIPSGLFGLSLARDAFAEIPGLAFLNLPAPVVTALALILGVFFLYGAWRAATEPDRDVPLLALCFAAASLAAFALFTLTDKPWVAGKGLSYFYFFVAALPFFAVLAPGRKVLRPRPARLAMGVGQVALAFFLAWQLAFAGLRPAYAVRDADYPRYVRNHGRYRTLDCELAPIRAALRRAKAREVAVCSADPWKWAFLGLALDDRHVVREPGYLAKPQHDAPQDDPVFVALDRPVAGPPAELAPYLAAENAAFALYRMPRAVLAGLLPGLDCAPSPF